VDGSPNDGCGRVNYGELPCSDVWLAVTQIVIASTNGTSNATSATIIVSPGIYHRRRPALPVTITSISRLNSLVINGISDENDTKPVMDMSMSNQTYNEKGTGWAFIGPWNISISNIDFTQHLRRDSAISMQSGGSLSLHHCTFSNLTITAESLDAAAALNLVAQRSFIMTRCHFIRCSASAQRPSDIGIVRLLMLPTWSSDDEDTTGRVSIVDTTFVSTTLRHASSSVLWIQDASTVTLVNMTVADTSITPGNEDPVFVHGAVAFTSHGPPFRGRTKWIHVQSCSFICNVILPRLPTAATEENRVLTGIGGAALSISLANVTSIIIIDTIFINNSIIAAPSEPAVAGGALLISVWLPQPFAAHVILSNNITISRCLFDSNGISGSSYMMGGAAFFEVANQLSIIDTIFINNHIILIEHEAQSDRSALGGGVYSDCRRDSERVGDSNPLHMCSIDIINTVVMNHTILIRGPPGISMTSEVGGG
jgi:hypothetical protein